MTRSTVVSWFVDGILPGVVASSAVWVYGVLRKRKSARKRWQLKTPGNVLICVSSSTPVETEHYSRPATGIGQAKALALISPSLLRAYRSIDIQNIHFAGDIKGTDYEADLILIGGPKTNTLTDQALVSISDSMGITQVGSEIRAGNSTFVGNIENESGVDYGLVVRTTNPFSSGNRLVILSGSHTFGTIAAARFMVESRFLAKNKTDAAMIVRATIKKGHALSPEYIWSSDDS